MDVTNEEKGTIIRNSPSVKFVLTIAVSKVNADSRTKRLLLVKVHDITSSNSLSMYALASLPQAEITDSRHLNVTNKATSIILTDTYINMYTVSQKNCATFVFTVILVNTGQFK